MVDKIKFIMILHNHQPVGNFDWVFKDAAEDAYIPFIDILEDHPAIKFGLHTSGSLLEWFEKNRPDYLKRVKALVKRGQLEILGGAFYEPILTILPDQDKRGQLEMMTGWLQDRFGVRPSGAWLAERIWEPQLASVVARVGLSYTAMDNTHFQSAGLADEDIWGSYVTEDQGLALRILPIDYRLRYLIPFHTPQETIDYLGKMRERGVSAVTYADDGEKFGVWPGTHELVYKREWLACFFELLEQHSSWIETVHAGEYVRSTPPLGPVYLPTASYKEMMEWALPVDAQKRMDAGLKLIEDDSRFDVLKPFIRGGFWRNFLAKYPESDNMYRRMLLTSCVVESFRSNPSYAEAVRELYMAQCNCAYWHGVFGGLYLNFLRRAVYEHLIKADRILTDWKPHVNVDDINGDGYQEVILDNGILRCFIAPNYGGAAYELDDFAKTFNLMDTFTRREEVYHSKIEPVKEGEEEKKDTKSIHDRIQAKSEDVLQYLQYDWYRRLSLLDHFMEPYETLDSFAKVQYHELGDFVNQPFSIIATKTSPQPQVTLERKGGLWYPEGKVPATVRKMISMASGSVLTAQYKVTVDRSREFRFGIEFNLGLQSGYSDDSYIEIPGRALADPRLASTGEEKNVKTVSLIVGWMPLKVTLTFSKPATLWRLPIETVSLSEGGVEHNYQNTCLVPVWNIMPGKDPFTVQVEMAVA